VLVTKKPGEAEPAPLRPEGSIPDIKVDYKPAGRETLEAITAELVPLPTSPRRDSSSPEITIREGVIERDTLAAIMAEAGADQPASTGQAGPTATPGALPLEIFELFTYVVRGGDLARLASESQRKRFAEEHLLARLPVKSASEIERVDVTPWTVQGTFVVRVWCRTS
jgi:hypothetical protein